jgi:hypothetical protein
MARSTAGWTRRYKKEGLQSTTAAYRRLQGMDRVMRNLNMELDKMRRGSAQGLLEDAAEFIHADTEKTPPLTPVDTGNLRSSWTTRFFRRNKKSVVIFGYSANYALYVHEMIGPINWSRKNSGAKWFEYAIKRNYNRLIHIIAGRAKIR